MTRRSEAEIAQDAESCRYLRIRDEGYMAGRECGRFEQRLSDGYLLPLGVCIGLPIGAALVLIAQWLRP